MPRATAQSARPCLAPIVKTDDHVAEITDAKGGRIFSSSAARPAEQPRARCRTHARFPRHGLPAPRGRHPNRIRPGVTEIRFTAPPGPGAGWAVRAQRRGPASRGGQWNPPAGRGPSSGLARRSAASAAVLAVRGPVGGSAAACEAIPVWATKDPCCAAVSFGNGLSNFQIQ